jgi:hypothetical protein
MCRTQPHGHALSAVSVINIGVESMASAFQKTQELKVDKIVCQGPHLPQLGAIAPNTFTLDTTVSMYICGIYGGRS